MDRSIRYGIPLRPYKPDVERLERALADSLREKGWTCHPPGSASISAPTVEEYERLMREVSALQTRVEFEANLVDQQLARNLALNKRLHELESQRVAIGDRAYNLIELRDAHLIALCEKQAALDSEMFLAERLAHLEAGKESRGDVP
jgi:hypothetical protein